MASAFGQLRGVDNSGIQESAPEDLAKFPFGQLKGKWVGMTKDKLAQLTK